jgi:hypothetical protein
MDAGAAVFELSVLKLKDQLSYLFKAGQSFSTYTKAVNWLNRNRDRIAANSPTDSVRDIIVSARSQMRNLALTDVELGELCAAYDKIAQYSSPGRVPPSQVVLELVSRRHAVSARLVTDLRATATAEPGERKRHKKARKSSKKARS